jgi:Ca2+-binding EF-hand superfamily protein
VESDRTLREIKELSVQLDEDHTGTLDRNEFQALMETMAEGAWEEAVDPTTGRVYCPRRPGAVKRH